MNFVFSGPSGSGKGTITELLLKSEGFKKFVTCTTRRPRENERNGFDYIFLDESDFLSKVQLGEMFNVKLYGGNYYGSLEKDMDNIKSDKNIVFQLTPDRALEMKRKNKDTCLILILPPSVESLSERRKNRNSKRIENDIQNLEVAKQFDYVIINDDLEIACMEILSVICDFKLMKDSSLSATTQENQLKIQTIIDGLVNDLNKYQSQWTIFDGDVAKKWDEKSIFVNYYGIKNPIVQEIFLSAKNGMKIADIGCGTGKTITKLDKQFEDCSMIGLDLSSDMVMLAKKKDFTNNNEVKFINGDFMNYDFKDKFDMIIFSYVLHHIKNPQFALEKAKDLLNRNGQIIFSVPGKGYLSEIFEIDNSIGRFSMKCIDKIVEDAGLFPLTANRNQFMMKFNSYEIFLKYLKSIGTYQKIVGYTNNEWSDEFNKETLVKFNEQSFISGEYLTYNCIDKEKLLVKR